MEQEIWKPIKGYDGFYEISSFGRVKSYHIAGRKNKNNNGVILKARLDRYGYEYLSLNLRGKRKTCKPHRLVALHFIGLIENKNQVNHINGIKTDNRVCNLEWCNCSENQRHLYDTLGHVCKNRKLTIEQATQIRKYLCENRQTINKKQQIKDIANQHNVCVNTIYSIIKSRFY